MSIAVSKAVSMATHTQTRKTNEFHVYTRDTFSQSRTIQISEHETKTLIHYPNLERRQNKRRNTQKIKRRTNQTKVTTHNDAGRR